MKFLNVALSLLSLSAAAVAAPVANEDVAVAVRAEGTVAEVSEVVERANCNLHVHWVTNWSEAGWRRYRVKAWADVGGSRGNAHEMLQKWTSLVYTYKSGVFVGVNNLATWYENDNLAFSDLSFWEGSAGHNLYLEFHQVVVNDWRAWSNGCDVDSRF